jgi:hypothetical protein
MGLIMKGYCLGFGIKSRWSLWYKELPPLTMGLIMKGYCLGFSINSRWSLWSKVMGTSDHLRYMVVADKTTMTS